MNGAISSAASSAAGATATSASTAGTGVSSLTSGSNALKMDTNELAQNGNNITNFPNNNNSPLGETNEISTPDEQLGVENQNNYFEDGSQLEDNSSLEEEQLPESQEEHQKLPGDDLGNHKKVGEDGQVEDNSKVKLEKALVTGAATYLGGGEGAKIASNINSSGMADPIYGIVDDATNAVPGAGEVINAAAEELDEAGVTDGINDLANAYAKASEGDLKGAIEGAKNVKKDLEKAKKYTRKKILIPIFCGVFITFIVVILIISICGPVLGGFLDIIEEAGETIEDIGNFIGDSLGGTASSNLDSIINDADNIVSEIPGYEDLSETRQKIVYSASLGLSSGIKYDWGGKPTGPGLSGVPQNGLDSSGFVAWVLWTSTDNKPGALGTSSMVQNIGILFEEITAEELKPGDLGLFHKTSGTNHAGVYVGNNQWIHDSSGKERVVRTNNPGFKIYLRYKGVD